MNLAGKRSCFQTAKPQVKKKKKNKENAPDCLMIKYL